LSWDWKTLSVYGVAVVASVPFMVPALQLGSPFGSLAYLFGGADFSYFISFAIACVLTYAVRRRAPMPRAN
jgi:cytosine/uracil/thiamine/allantoin permease